MSLSTPGLTTKTFNYNLTNNTGAKGFPTMEANLYKKDVFSKGSAQRFSGSSTKDAIRLMENGESAGNILILFLKNGKFEQEVAHSVLTCLEGTVPFLNIALRAPGFMNTINQKRTEPYRAKIKSEMEYFFKHPNSKNLDDWKKAENDQVWEFLTPASDMYDQSVREFHKSSDHLIGRPSPTLISHQDLVDSIRRKNTALGTMFLFNTNNIPTHGGIFGYGGNIGVQGYGLQMLEGTNRFDLMTALKIGDLYKSKFTKKEMAHFYDNLCTVICTECDSLSNAEAKKLINLFQAKVKQDIKDGYADPDHFYHHRHYSLSPSALEQAGA